MFNVDAKEVYNLSSQIFVETMNYLLRAEASKFHIPRTRLNLSLRISDPDAGVDARVQDWPLKAGYIPEGLSVWQFKAGKVDISDIKTECKKPGVLEALRAGGAYCVCMARDYTDKDVEIRREAILETVAREGIGLEKVVVFNGSTIADWITSHPAVVKSLGHPIGSLMSHSDLSGLKLHRYSYRSDSERDDIVEGIRKQIDDPHGSIVQRIEGRPGVGKTRLVIEALRPEGFCERVMYAPQCADVPPEFFGWMADNVESSAILVVDECDEKSHERLTIHAERCGGRVRLVTIGSEYLGGRRPEGYYYLDVLSDAKIREIVETILPNLPTEAVVFVIRSSSGYVKLAVALTRSLASFPGSVQAIELARSHGVQSMLQLLLPDPPSRNSLRGLSLLRKVGWERQTKVRLLLISWGLHGPQCKMMSKTSSSKDL